MLRCLFCFEPCSRAHVESEEEVNQRALQELQSIGNLRHPSSPTQALNGSVIQADAFSNAEGNNTNSGGTADAQQEGQQQGQHASFGRKGVKSCHDDFEVNRAQTLNPSQEHAASSRISWKGLAAKVGNNHAMC
eukprot:1159483-Pelagomonas_calceolata.AAC.10